jgi:nucleoside-diphosphate-sugar epimerase
MILITGGIGFIGSHLVEAVCARGEPLRCLVRRDSSKRHPFALPAEVELVFGDLVSGEGLSDALEGATTVIHLAGVTKALSTREFYSGNARATENLARAVAGREVRLVYVSSLAAIGPSTDGTPVSEDSEPHPITHYGKSKLEGERIARALVPDAVIVRPPVVYGPRDTDVLEMLRSIGKGFVLKISGGERWFKAIYVKDLAEGLLAAACAPQTGGRAYFLAQAKAVL